MHAWMSVALSCKTWGYHDIMHGHMSYLTRFIAQCSESLALHRWKTRSMPQRRMICSLKGAWLLEANSPSGLQESTLAKPSNNSGQASRDGMLQKLIFNPFDIHSFRDFGGSPRMSARNSSMSMKAPPTRYSGMEGVLKAALK